MIWLFVIASVGIASALIYVEPEYLSALRDEGNDEEFARLLGIEDVSLVRPSNKERSENIRWKSVSSMGDILLTKEQSEKAPEGLRFDKYPEYQWPFGEIPYVIQANDYTLRQLIDIERRIADFNYRVDNVQIVKRRLILPQRDYVMIFSGNGCYSYIGRHGGQQALSLQARGCLNSGTVQHEFMHAAGFAHEQNRPDRDKYIKVIPKNIPEEFRSQYDKVSEEDFGFQGPYDYYSLMHFPVKAPGTDLPAFKVLQAGIDETLIGKAKRVTDTDADKLNKLYNKLYS